jgi:glycosyltransferase involved in cell wall biosynthesis
VNKIVFVNRYYRPDHSATAQLLTDLAEHMAAKGIPIAVVCSRQTYDNSRQRLPAHEQLGKVAIHRVWTTVFGRHNLLGRAIDYLTFYISCFFRLLILVRPGDILVVKTDPPMLSVIGATVAALKRAKLINWLQDLFPEVAKQLGIGIMKTPLYGALKWLRNRSLRCACSNIVLGELMAKRINNEIGQPEKSVIIPNWVVHSDILPVTHELNTLRHVWNLDNKFVVGYSGNLGRAHEFKTILDAILLLTADPHIHFLFIGGGAQLAPVKHFVTQHQLANVSFKPYQLVEMLPSSLSAADVHLVSLQPELEGLIVPSKFYGIVAVGRPVIFIGSAGGELATLIQTHKCGTTIAPGDSASLAQYILFLKNNTQEQAKASNNSQRLGSTNFTRFNSIRAWESVLSLNRVCQ